MTLMIVTLTMLTKIRRPATARKAIPILANLDEDLLDVTARLSVWQARQHSRACFLDQEVLGMLREEDDVALKVHVQLDQRLLSLHHLGDGNADGGAPHR